MFELPDAKRVRRKDLFDSDPADSASDGEQQAGHDQDAESALRAKLDAQLAGLFDFSFTVEPAAQQQKQVDKPESHPESEAEALEATDEVQQNRNPPEEEAFNFRLFRDEAPTRTVILTPDGDPAALGRGGFIVPSRPRSYYIASAPSPERASEYRSVAVSAEYVFADAKSRRWGLEKPWRVTHISSNKSISASAYDVNPTGQAKDKKRPGKKHRIILRVREKTAREREEAMKKLTMDKEQHLQEKKKRLNRERKLKRRQKEREKKTQGQTTNPGCGGADADITMGDDNNSRASSPGN